MNILRQGIPSGTNNFDLITFTLEFDLFLAYFYCSLAKNFWTVSARVYTFYMNISSGKAFQWIPTFCFFVTLTLESIYFFFNVNLINNAEHWVLELVYFTWKF